MIETEAQIQVKTINERSEMIAGLIEQEPKKFVDFNFEKTDYQCPEIKIDSDFLIYRLENTRTNSQQLEEISVNNLDEQFFAREMEVAPEVQKRQHKLLFNEVDKPLKKAFESKGGQTEGLIISVEGRVINGNRRLSYMREQAAEGNTQYNQIKCVVLNDRNLQGIDREAEIEAYLDYSPNAKKEYGWINQGLAIEKMKDEDQLDFKEIKIRKSYGTENEAKRLYERIKLARESLQRRNKAEQFSLLKKSEQIYKELGNFFVSNPGIGEDQKEKLKAALFIFDAADSNKLGDRPYEYITWMKKNIHNTETINNFLNETIGLNNNTENPFGSTDGTVAKSAVNEIIVDLSKSDSCAIKMKDFIEAEQLQQKRTNKKNTTKDELTKAYQSIKNAKLPLLTGDMDQNTDTVKVTIESIRDDLDEIEQKLF